MTFNAGESSYSKGSIVKYEWDLKGTGKYETTTTTPTVTTSYSSEQTVKVGLRVIDSNGGWSYTTQEVKVGSFPPVAHVSLSPSAPLTGQKVTLNASGSSDQGTITDYKWDLEGKGTYETNTGTTPTVTTYFNTAGRPQRGAGTDRQRRADLENDDPREGARTGPQRLTPRGAEHAWPDPTTTSSASRPARRSPTARARATAPSRRHVRAAGCRQR